MNKKFYTLVAAIMLSGSVFVGSAYAEGVSKVDTEAVVALEKAADNANYYYLHVNGSSTNIVAGDKLFWDGDALTYSAASTVKWTVEKSGQSFKLKDEKGNYLAFKYAKAEGKEYGAATLKADKKGDINTFFILTNNSGNNYLVSNIGGVNYYLGALNSASKTAVLLRHEKSEGGVTTGSYNVWNVGLTAIAPVSYKAEDLEKQLDGKFGIQIGYKEKKQGDSEEKWYEYGSFEGGNVFEGDLYAEDAEDVEGGVALYKDSKKTQRIVLLKEKWDEYTSASGEGNKFKVMTSKEYEAETKETNPDKKKVAADVFRISVPSNVKGEPLEVVAISKDNTVYEVVVSVIKKADGTKVNRLTVDNGYANNLADYTKTASNGADNTYIKFGASNAVNMNDFIGQLWNIYKNDQIASPDCDKEYVATAQVAAEYPEGQWLWNGIAFVNRESGKSIIPSGLRYSNKDNVYTSGKDTYRIVPAGTPSDKATVGYLNGYTSDLLKQKAFFIGAPIESTGDTVYLSKTADGVLKLVADKSEAVEFRLNQEAFDKDHKTAQNRTEYLAWKDKAAGTTETKTDVVSFYQYGISEAVTGDVLYYDTKEERYILTDTTGWYKDNEEAKATIKPFVFKNKNADTYNILKNVTTQELTVGDNSYAVTNQGTTDKTFCDDAQKIYGAFNTSDLVETKQAYDFVQNDLFVVVDADAQQYRGDFSNAGALDTIKVFRNDDNSYVLYEKGELLSDKNGVKEGFLGMENFLDPQYAVKNPALLADTAFISNTYRPQYLLAVGAEIVADGWTCPYNPEHNTTEWRAENGGHCPDAVKDRPFVSGRYLVNLVDSAKAQKNPIKNKFTYEMYQKNQPYYRLGFVQAIHVGDSLIIASTNDTINLANNPVDKTCTFAFKYVDAERDAFTIETLYDYALDADGDVASRTRGYIKYHNGVPVVTPKASEAWVFDLETLKGQAPTANEAIDADATVSVVAANGAVIIKNAAGKKVAISNILGKSIANETVASDNETVAVPAGIVVVAVEGEEAVKVVVK